MKTLDGYSLIYDDDCPLCKWYTGLFIHHKYLDAQGRIAYHQTSSGEFPTIDFEKARNKIALLNRKNGDVMYGIDGLLKILGNRFSWISSVGKIQPIYWLLNQFYQFISFNRKVIIPVSCSSSHACTPSKHWLWRIIFILLCALTVNMFVNLYFKQHLSAYFIGNPVWGDSVLFIGQLIFQSIACYIMKERNVYDYLGHLSMISFIGAILLGGFGLGLNLIHSIGINIEMLEPLCYGIVFAWMFIEHRRRLKIAEMNPWLSLSWLVYRFMIYPMAFSLT